MSILFKDALILQRDEKGKYYTIKGFLGVKDDYINYIGIDYPNKKYDQEIDYKDKLLMPGLYDSHSHIPMVMLKGIGSGKPLHEWLYDCIFPLEAKLTPLDIKWASYFALLELIRGGVTSFTDMYFYPTETCKAVINSGLKANLNRCVQCFDDNLKIEDSTISESLNLYKEYNNKANERLKIDFCIHAEYTCKPHIIKAYSQLCKENNGRMHLHLSETKKEVEECKQRYGKSPVELFEELGTFDNPTIAAHCVWVSEEDIDILKNHNVFVVHNPTSNMMLGSGFMPLKKFIDKGINVGLGTDGQSSNNNLNMFEEMHLASLLHCGYNLDPAIISNDYIIDMATINGAKLQGRDNCGQLKEGYKADIIGIDLNNYHLYPNLDIAALITHSMQESDVILNMVDGNILYINGEFKTRVKEFYK